jgi:hypothetical protein
MLLRNIKVTKSYPRISRYRRTWILFLNYRSFLYRYFNASGYKWIRPSFPQPQRLRKLSCWRWFVLFGLLYNFQWWIQSEALPFICIWTWQQMTTSLFFSSFNRGLTYAATWSRISEHNRNRPIYAEKDVVIFVVFLVGYAAGYVTY